MIQLKPYPAASRVFVAALLACAAVSGTAWAADSPYPITSQQRDTAQKVAQAGVALSELAPNAPDSHTVRPGDTLWAISKLFLKSPWRWPELWGMNLDQIRNPHLIYPGQLLVLDKSNGRARLRVATSGPGGVVKLSPRVRSEVLDNGAIASVPLHLIGPFLNEAVIFDNRDLEAAPRIVAAPEGRVMMSRGDTAYVRGDLGNLSKFRLFREPKPLADPETGEILGYEGRYVGTADYVRAGEVSVGTNGLREVVPATFTITSVRQEANVGDRLAPAMGSDLGAFQPHAPKGEMQGRIVSVYGEALQAGQNQIVTINRGSRDGMERGHVLALWRAGEMRTDTTDPKRQVLRLPDEQHGHLFVFRVFERTAYALILDALEPVRRGDRFTQP